MGCDIYSHIEIKIKGAWHHYSAPSINRKYSLFDRIAGVRHTDERDITPISAPRGIPADASLVTRIFYGHEGGHSATWLSKQEFNDLIEWEETREGGNPNFQHKEVGYLTGNTFKLSSGDRRRAVHLLV